MGALCYGLMYALSFRMLLMGTAMQTSTPGWVSSR